jgi:kinetochore protein Mis13/DSN1
LRPPSLPPLTQRHKTTNNSKIDRSLLSESGAAALDSIASTSSHTSSEHISRRVNSLLESIGPTIDQFADGVHRLGQYRTAAENVAGKVLAICAEKITEREKEGRKKVLSAVDQTQPQDTPPKDLGSVLRSLSRADR